ncbi:Long chain acyl-CoA synthetase 7 peroxisomal, partial [Kappamyces sp. JEL0680]
MSRLTLPETTEETLAEGFKYSYEVEDAPAIAGEGKPRRTYSSKGPMLTTPPGVTNLLENMKHGVEIGGDKKFLGHRPMIDGVAGPYVWQTYKQVYARIKNLGSALINRGYNPEENIGLFSINRPEWVIGEYACFWSGLVTVPLYDTLGDEAIEYIMQKCEIPLVFATADKAAVLLKLAPKLPALKSIVLMNEAKKELTDAAAKTKIQLIDIKKLEEEGSQKPQDHRKTATALLTHGNLLSFVAGSLHMMEHNQMYKMSKDDMYISYLPLAHVLERIVQVTLMYLGATIGFYQGDTLKLMDDMAVLQPTLFASVPRL